MLDWVISLILYVLLFIGVFFFFQNMVPMYYRYFYYTSQGIPSVGFPLPIVGHMPQYVGIIKRLNEIKTSAIEK